ncbi:MAG: hypothetical protein JWQ90_5252 [Hydrocarboniphaga sp.]|uniref:TIGR01777 family oxidoreductase n=1 Tax=Hydrocarboniphaga sp. TaxID=2033016 RepID=UPI0026256A43|nr:TIGR01777 family oxidoreductase [Hydrocarboniphaga sp.]MDB5972802.1 hypothetical protein [Hydrocarboniphaga sp.]
MTAVLTMFTIQCLLGAFDNLWHHELQADLPHQPTARRELALHTARELLYALIFISVAWWRWEGAWTFVLIAILAAEMLITLCDFVEEDRSRKLPAFERVLHTILALNYGALLALWAPELRRWSQAPGGFAAADYGIGSWLLTAFGIGVFAWGMRDLFAVARLAVPEWQRMPMRAGDSNAPSMVLVTGATGFIGRSLVRRLVERGDQVIVLTRNVARARDRFGPLVEVTGDLREIDDDRCIDTIVNLAGEPLIGLGLWTRKRKQRFIDSRVGTTRRIAGLIGRLRTTPKVLVSASAIGWYGERGDEVLSEKSTAGEGFLSELCWKWEDAAMTAARPGLRICRMRIGLVLGAHGGVLKSLALATRMGGGMVLGSGRQWQSWIHIDDLVALFEHAISTPTLSGPINAVSPHAVTQREFTLALGETLHRPTLMRMPEWPLRRLAGDMAELFLVSQRVLPQRAMDSGFEFRWARIEDALRHSFASHAAREQALAVYVNQDCPVCRSEMGRYCELNKRHHGAMRFRSIAKTYGGLPRYGLTERDLRRRLFVESGDGKLCSGIDGAILIWRCLPGIYPRLAKLLAQPFIHAIADCSYDLVIAPALSGWSERRIQRRRRLASVGASS